MTEQHGSAGLRGRVSKTTAAQILQKAADLDAIGDEMIDLRELQLAAEDAGISARSFDLSVAEMRKKSLPPQRSEARKGISYMAVTGAGMLGGVAALLVPSIFAGGPPPADALMGAVIGGAGVVVGVVTYLRVAFRSRPPAGETDG